MGACPGQYGSNVTYEKVDFVHYADHFFPGCTCGLGTKLISTLSELTVNPLMVTGNVAEKRRICRSVGRNEINLSSACW